MNITPRAASPAPPEIRRGASATVYASPALHRLQLRHFMLFDVLPLLGVVVAMALLPVLPPRPVDLLMFFGLWLATGLGLTVGFHRYFSHQSFKTTPVVAGVLLVLGSMAARGPMISWAAMHRRHHQKSDREGDLHSPNLQGPGAMGRLRGLVHAQFTWMVRHDYPNVTHYVPDLLRDRTMMRLNRNYYWWVALGLVLPAAVGAVVTGTPAGAVTGFLWGGVVRLFVVEQTMSAINSVCHMFGRRPYEQTSEDSRNNGWLALPSWGEAFHNNHHAFPASAAFGLRWYQPDPGYWFIGALAFLGLAWDVRRPSAKGMSRTRGDLP